MNTLEVKYISNQLNSKVFKYEYIFKCQLTKSYEGKYYLLDSYSVPFYGNAKHPCSRVKRIAIRNIYSRLNELVIERWMLTDTILKMVISPIGRIIKVNKPKYKEVDSKEFYNKNNEVKS